MSDGIPLGARCGSHPLVAAVDLCQRCGRFLCGECLELFDEESYCGDCARKLAAPASGLARSALVLSGVSWLIFGVSLFGLRAPLFAMLFLSAPLPLALLSLVMALLEGWRIKRGDTAAKGRRLVLATFFTAAPLFLLMVGLFAWGAWKALHYEG